MPSKRFTIQNMPLRGALTTAGQQGTIPETMLWQAKNCSAGLDGLLTKRPGLTQWGQVLKQPSRDSGFSQHYILDNADSRIITDGSTAIFSIVDRRLQLYVPANAGTQSNCYCLPQGAVTEPTESDWTLRFSVQGINLDVRQDVYIYARTRLDETNVPLFKLTGNTVDYWTGGSSWSTLGRYTVTDKPVHTFELRFDADGNVTLYINEEEKDTVAVSAISTSAFGAYDCYLRFRYVQGSATTSAMSFVFSDIMMEGNTDGLEAVRLGAGTDFKIVTGGPSARRYLLLASERMVYMDQDQKQIWTPLLRMPGPYTTFAQFKDDLLIFNGDEGIGGQVWRWKGREPSRLEDAPAVRFGSEHR